MAPTPGDARIEAGQLSSSEVNDPYSWGWTVGAGFFHTDDYEWPRRLGMLGMNYRLKTNDLKDGPLLGDERHPRQNWCNHKRRPRSGMVGISLMSW